MQRVITGDVKLNRILAKLTSKQAKAAIRKASRAALKPVLQQARANAKSFKDTGLLGRSIKIRSIKRSRSAIGSRVTVSTETGKFDKFYAAFQEYGWKAGPTKVAGQNYMKDAATTKQPEVIRIYSNKIKNIVFQLAK